MNQYVLWKVIENTDKGVKEIFLIVNRATKSVQSSWKSYLEAQATCDKLNHWVNKEVI